MKKLFRQITVYLISAFVVIFCACTKKNTAQPADISTSPIPTGTTTTSKETYVVSKNTIVTPITGLWRQFKFIGMGNYTGVNTASFGSDSTMSYLRNDTLLIRTNYTYQDNFKFPDNSIGAKVEISSLKYKCTLANDTLKLATYDVWDGGTNWYVKVKK